MRTPHNDRALTHAASSRDAGPERRCILTGDRDARAGLTRLALSPDGDLVPDIMARAPGRGAWMGVNRAALETAIAKGKLKGALARAFKGEPVRFSPDLPDQLAQAFQRTFLSQLGLASKAGALLTGAEKIDVAARAGQVKRLYHAADAADDGRRKRDQSWRVGEDEEGSGKAGRILPVDRTVLSVALGRDNAVHIAIIEGGWATRLTALLDRWHDYAGSASGDDAAGQIDSDEVPTANGAIDTDTAV